MSYRYVAVDITRSNILLVASSLSNLNKKILSEEGQILVNRQALWIYKIEAATLMKVEMIMAKTNASFNSLTRPAEY